MGARGVAHDHDTVRVAAEFGRVVMCPAERFRDVREDLVHRDRLHVTMVGRDEDVAEVREELRLQLDARLLAALPAASVDPEDDRRGLGGLGCRCVDVQRLAELGGAGIRDIGHDRREFRFHGDDVARDHVLEVRERGQVTQSHVDGDVQQLEADHAFTQFVLGVDQDDIDQLALVIGLGADDT